MSFNFTEIIETVRIKQNKLELKVITVGGKEDEHFVLVSPSLLVSGYGSTEEEAENSFKENMELFCKDFMNLTSSQRDYELKKLGFNRERFKTKNFSKAYVDENGVLQGLDPQTKKVSMLEALV